MLGRVEHDDDKPLRRDDLAGRDVLAADHVLAAETSQDFGGGFGRERFETFRVGDLAEIDDEISWRQGLRAQTLAGEGAERGGGASAIANF